MQHDAGNKGDTESMMQGIRVTQRAWSNGKMEKYYSLPFPRIFVAVLKLE